MAMPESEPASLCAAWQATVATRSCDTALVDASSRRLHTFTEIEQASTAFAAALPGALAGQRISFSLPNGAAWLAAFLGILRAGAIPIPLDPAEPAARQLEIAAAARAAIAWIDGRSTLLTTTRLRRSAPRHIALFKLTSGTTGSPRILPFSHTQMLADGRQICAGMSIRPDDLNLAVIPFGHSYGLGNLVLPLLLQGTAIVCADAPLPHSLAATAAQYRPTLFPAVPALLRALAEAELPDDAFAALRTVISAGSPLPAATATAFFKKFGLKPHAFYGSSETGGIAYDPEGDDTLEGRGVGRPLPGVTILPLRSGRIRVLSPAVLVPGGHSPADRARLEPGGRLVLLGRVGRMIKIGGRRLDLGDLECALRRIPGVADAFAAPHPEDPEQIAAVLATELAPIPLRALLLEHLTTWKIPRRLVAVRSFPLTPRGKPDTAALRLLLKK